MNQEAEKRQEALRQIKDEVLALKISPLYKYRLKHKYLPVIGEGNHFARIMFVGEAPGETEAKTARPFCGQAGKILDLLLSVSGLKREDVYITNLVKDRPPENRDPKPEEILLYSSFLDRQIEIIQPKVIATLGRHSLLYILDRFGLKEKFQLIGKIHGQKFMAEASYGPITIVALYHPAAAIYSRKLLPTLEEDIKKIVRVSIE